MFGCACFPPKKPPHGRIQALPEGAWRGMWAVFLSVLGAALLWYRSRFRRPALLSLPPRAEARRRVRDFGEKWHIVVVGGAGNLGQWVVRVLLRDYGHRVQTITVFDMREGEIRDQCVTYVVGDLTRFGDVEKTLRGADVVFHLASLIDLRSAARHWPVLHNVNVVGTHHVVEACVQNAVGALVYTGSLAARKDTPGPVFRDECRRELDAHGENTIWSVDPDKCVSLYGKSKNLGERAVIAANERAESSLRTGCILPCQVFGFQDRFQYDMLLPELKLGKQSPGVIRVDEDEGGIGSFSLNESCADLHIKLAEALMGPKRDEIGGRSFYAVDFDCPTGQFFRDADLALATASRGAWKHRPVPNKVLPRPLAHAIGFVAGLIDWFYDGCVRGDVYQLNFIEQIKTYSCGDLRCSSEAAIKTLGFKPVPAKEAHERVSRLYAERELGIKA